MNLKHYLYMPLWSALALFAFTGCSDDNIVSEGGKIPEGNGIVFGASASYSKPSTRVEYGDYEYKDGYQDLFEYRISQDLNWVEGDRVSIFSPTSPNTTKQEYKIDNVQQTDASKAYLAVIDGNDGLQWSADATQDFYAVYPSRESMSNTTVKDNYVSFDDGVLTGYVPINQQHEITYNEGTGTWTAKPNMDYLYMAAVQKGWSTSNDGISLDFVPLTTTLEVTLVGPTTTPIASFNIEAADANGDPVPVVGQFRCDLKTAGTTAAGNFKTAPDCVSLQQGTTNSYATVSCYWNDNGTQKPLTLQAGEEITFNVFLLPNNQLDKVTIRVAGFNTNSRSLTFKDRNGTTIKLNPHTKTCVKIPAPVINAGGTNEWITGIDGSVYVSQLSIPGTANSFSYSYSGDNKGWYAAQVANFEKQWNAGIRCFELECSEKVDNYNTNQSSSAVSNLEFANLGCNRTNIGMTFGDAVDLIWNKVRGTREFAMIIPAYESGSGHGGDAVRNFANALNQFYDTHMDYEYITYGRDVTVDQARGKLMFVARITSEEDENSIDDIAPHQGVIVKGWGSLKDLWNRRGYDAPNWGDANNNFQSSIEYKMVNNNRSEGYSFTMPTAGENNFMHNTIREDGSTGTAYVQDWSRVSKESKNYKLYDAYERHKYDYSQYAYWPESFTEKCGDVWNTFLAAIEDNNNQQGSTFYINSLHGFYVDENIPLSYTPYIAGRGDSYTDSNGDRQNWSYTTGGTAGNIAAYATDINNYFYNEILKFGEDNIYGPMNVVLMDMVYATDDMTDSGSYLPSVIINNNYRFPLMKSDGGTNENPSTQNQADASYSNGGNVWK